MLKARLQKAFPAGPDSAAFSLDFEFEARPGVTVLFGPSGSGKTLTLDLLAGFVRADQGRILLDDNILYDGASGVHLTPQARHTGYVFQNYALFPHMTVRGNLEFAAERSPRLERHRRVTEMLEKFRLTEVAGRRPHEVSGGQRQRCSIARALIGAPKLLLLDEPAQGLDTPLKAELYEVIRQVRQEIAVPVILVSHDLEECFALGDEMLVLRNGRLVQSGKPQDVLDQPANTDVAAMLGNFNLMPGEVVMLDPGRDQSTARIEWLGETVELDGVYFPGHLKGDRVMLCIRPDLCKAVPRSGKPKRNQLPVELARIAHRPRWMHLEFEGGLTVDVPHAEFARIRDTEQWLIEMPAVAIRAL